MTDDRDRALRRHRALSDPSRARILAELAADGPLDVRELAGRVHLHPNTVRSHLGALADADLVTAETSETRTRGRPRRLYRAAADTHADDRRYRLLAEILTTLVARSGRRAAGELEPVGELWGRHMVESPPPLRPLPEREALARLVALLAEIGFQPRLEAQDGRRSRILMRPCPFLELARSHPDIVCPIHLGLMRGALAELGAAAQAEHLRPFAKPDLCVAELASAVDR